MIDYDAEAAIYDRTRGGDARAAAVASAVAGLLRPGGTLLDVACGTGIVTARLGRADGGLGAGRRVLGVDRSPGMLRVASPRLPGRLLLADAGRLPVSAGRVDAVLLIWLLHLLPDARPVLDEAARVLAPGGRIVTTVDKGAAMFAVPSDLADATAPWREPFAPTSSDHFPVVAGVLGRHGLRPVAEATFPGLGQGRSPRRWREVVRERRVPWALPDPEGVDRALAALPDQDIPRPEPMYRLVAFAREDR